MKCRFILFVLSFAIISSAAQAQHLQQITTIAGNGTAGFDGDGGSSVGAQLSGPLGVAVDGNGIVYVQDKYNNRIRKVTPAGVISTFAGNGIEGYTGDGSIANSAEVIPSGVAVDSVGNVYVADASFGVIRKINTAGIITTIAGTGTFGHTGDGGPATAARIGKPNGMAFDRAGNLYFADAGMNVVRKITKTGIISTVAGNDTAGYSGDGSAATLARLDSPYSVAVDRSGNVFISDFFNNVIRMVDASGTISTYAGIQGVYNYFGDGGMATNANLNQPRGIAVDTTGNLYIADAENNVIRMVDVSGIITTVAGNGSVGFGGDAGYAVSANLHNPFGVAVDRFGAIYIADANNQRVRKTFNAYLAVNDITSAAAVQVYPNPCTDNITIAGLKKADKVCVYDMAGRAVTAAWTVKNGGAQSFDISGLASGLYMLRTADAFGTAKSVVKLIKE